MNLKKFAERARAVVISCARVSPLLPCGQCGCWFLRYDRRAYVSRDARHDPSCPVCVLFEFDHGEAWAIWNDCQGVFTDSVFSREAEAQAELLAPEWEGTDSIVVPVSVLRVPDWAEDRRRFMEREFGR